MNKNSDLELAIQAAKNAAKIILNGFNKEISISIKKNKTLVTEIDLASENVIIKNLSTRYPILSEETRSTIDKSENIYWAVDPIDGTTNFTRKIPIFCVSIGLIKNNKPVIGVILNPATHELFYSEQDKGAFLNGKRIHVGSGSQLAFINAGYGLDSKIKSAEVHKRITSKFWDRHFGSTAYELATVATGKIDAFICHGDKLWDHAAGISILREAGGFVTDWKGNEWTPSTSYILAGNAEANKKIISSISSLQK